MPHLFGARRARQVLSSWCPIESMWRPVEQGVAAHAVQRGDNGVAVRAGAQVVMTAEDAIRPLIGRGSSTLAGSIGSRGLRVRRLPRRRSGVTSSRKASSLSVTGTWSCASSRAVPMMGCAPRCSSAMWRCILGKSSWGTTRQSVGQSGSIADGPASLGFVRSGPRVARVPAESRRWLQWGDNATLGSSMSAASRGRTLLLITASSPAMHKGASVARAELPTDHHAVSGRLCAAPLDGAPCR